MSVFRIEKNRNYTVMSNYHLKDRNLSLKSKGLLSVILSLPEDWNYTTRGLAAISKEGVDSIGTALKELETAGYLVRNKLRNELGNIIDTEYVVYESPLENPLMALPDIANPDTGSPDTENPYTVNPDMDKPYTENPHTVNPDMDKPYTENPYTVNPDTDKPYTVNPAQLITNISLKETKELITKESITKKQTNPCVSVPSSDTKPFPLNNTANQHQQAEHLTVKKAHGAGNPVNHAMTLVEHEQQFEQFWKLYPRKASKKTAKKAWMDISPDESLFAIIMAAIKIANQYWQSHNISLKHIPHPSTWLTEERWEDEYSAEQLTGSADSANTNPDINSNKGGVHNANIGANYTIGGDDDPYRAIMPS